MVFKLKYITPHCAVIERGRLRPRPLPGPPAWLLPSPRRAPPIAARGRHSAVLGAALRDAAAWGPLGGAEPVGLRPPVPPQPSFAFNPPLQLKFQEEMPQPWDMCLLRNN